MALYINGIQQFIASNTGQSVDYKGGYDAATNTPDLDTSPSGVIRGDSFTVTAAGNFFTIAVEVGDYIIAEIDSAAVEADWTIVSRDYTDSTIKVAYENNADTNEFSDAEQTKLSGIEASATADQTDAEIKTAYENNADTNEFSDAEQTKLSGVPAGTDAMVQFNDSGSLGADAGFVFMKAASRVRLAGPIEAQWIVEANTAVSASPNVLTASESRKVLTNEGATAENHHNLPVAVAAGGQGYTFIVQDSDGIQINAAAGDTIRIAGSVSASGGLIEAAAIGSTVTLIDINATEWIATSLMGGPWTVT